MVTKKTCEVMVGGDSRQTQNLFDSIDIQRYSSFDRLLRSVDTFKLLAMAWKTYEKLLSRNKHGKLILPLGTDNLKEAEILVYKIGQLGLGQTKHFIKLVPFMDKTTGLLMTCGRLGSDIEPNFCVPILPSGLVAQLLAQSSHGRNHDGVDATMVRLRSRAWVISGRKIVKSIVYACVTCRKQRKAHLNQVMADLPAFRAQPNHPFAFCMVDFFGPIMVRGEVNKRTRGKVWGCVYACLSTRAVHVDIARDYGTDGFLLVHRRFQAVRGCPKTMYSDPGKNFIGASTELKKFTTSIREKDLQMQGGKVGTK